MNEKVEQVHLILEICSPNLPPSNSQTQNPKNIHHLKRENNMAKILSKTKLKLLASSSQYGYRNCARKIMALFIYSQESQPLNIIRNEHNVIN